MSNELSKKIITDFYANSHVTFYYPAFDKTTLCVEVPHFFAFKTYEVLTLAKNILAYKRMMLKIAKA